MDPEVDEWDNSSDEDAEARYRQLDQPVSLLKKTIYFRFGSRIIGATGTQSDHLHSNVLRLTIHSSILDRAIRTLLYPFPSALRSWVQSIIPEWVLPTNIVLKKQKDDWKKQFSTEVTTYKKLRSLQGHVIPMCYGQIEYDGTRALILSDIGGACLAKLEGAVLSEEELEPLLHQALSALASCGVSHDDNKLDNYHLVGKDYDRTIMVVDLEHVELLPSQEELDFAVESSTDHLMRAYRDHLHWLRHKALLLSSSRHAVDNGKKTHAGEGGLAKLHST